MASSEMLYGELRCDTIWEVLVFNLCGLVLPL
jgi:hypothetical protein